MDEEMKKYIKKKQERVAKNMTRRKKAKKIYADSNCAICSVNVCATLKPNGTFSGWFRVYVKGEGNMLLCSNCSGSVGIPVPIWCDLFRGE